MEKRSEEKQNKNIIDEIISSDISFNDLSEFCDAPNRFNYKQEGAFDKYFDPEKVEYVVRKYLSGFSNAKYVSYWAFAYNTILNGKPFFTNKNLTYKIDDFNDLMKFEINCVLESLSYYDIDQEQDMVDLNDYVKILKFYAKIYSIYKYCKIYYSIKPVSLKEKYLIFLVVDETGKEYALVAEQNLEYNVEDTGVIPKTPEEIDELVESLNKAGYKALYEDDF